MQTGAHLQTDEILALVKSHNERETKRYREYYESRSSPPRTETFEQELELYGFLARTCEGATPQALEELQSLAGVSLPPELRELYTTFGQLIVGHGRALTLFSVPEMVRRLRLQEGWQRFRSLGLIHMMNAAWTNHRPELEPGNGWLDPEEVDRLNTAYTCIGWSPTGDDEGFRYIYFDSAGAFGVVYYHQDEFGELYDETLIPMLSRSPACHTLSRIILVGLRDPFTFPLSDPGEG
jgi:hypothetical protein